jgi:hypothetical protein
VCTTAKTRGSQHWNTNGGKDSCRQALKDKGKRSSFQQQCRWLHCSSRGGIRQSRPQVERLVLHAVKSELLRIQLHPTGGADSLPAAGPAHASQHPSEGE